MRDHRHAIPKRETPPESLEQHVGRLQDELALRTEELRELRGALDRLYDRLARWDHQTRTRLQELQAEVARLGEEQSDGSAATLPMVEAPMVEAPRAASIAYPDLIRRVRQRVDATLPADATVLVISRGDDELLRLHGRKGGHFPQQEDGVYAGFYPAESASAIAHLEQLRAQGAEYLVIPRTALWWLDYYPEFATHLQQRYPVLVRQDDTCWIIDLKRRETARSASPAVPPPEAGAYRALKEQLHELISVLLPPDAPLLVVSRGDDELVRRCGDQAQHFPQDPDGTYAGYHPARSEDAIAHLESLRKQGAAFLLFPHTAFWWLDYYQAFRAHLEARYPVVCRQRYLCLIFDLASPRHEA